MSINKSKVDFNTDFGKDGINSDDDESVIIGSSENPHIIQKNNEPASKLVRKETNRSTSRVKDTKLTEVDKGLAFVWYGSKRLKLAFTILHYLGSGKEINFTQFMHFYVIINAMVDGKDSKTSKFTQEWFDKIYNNNVTNSEQPHFIWAALNPNRDLQLRKKYIREYIKVCVDKNDSGRKILLTSLENLFKENNCEDDEAERRLSTNLNFPGIK